MVTMTRAERPLSRPLGNPRGARFQQEASAGNVFHEGLQGRRRSTQPERKDEHDMVGCEERALGLDHMLVGGLRKKLAGMGERGNHPGPDIDLPDEASPAFAHLRDRLWPKRC
jgi:hypothetical protein